jgi:hypothetical protein
MEYLSSPAVFVPLAAVQPHQGSPDFTQKEILRRFVIARRRINNLQRLNQIKDQIVEQTFLKLGKGEGSN